MSGWDTPSRPTWDPQDGPEDGTQAFPVSDARGADSPWSQPDGSGWGGSSGSADEPSEYLAPDLGQPRKPGATLSGRGAPEPPWPGAARQESARPDYGRTGGFGEFGANGSGSGTGDYGINGDYGSFGANGTGANGSGDFGGYGGTGEFGRQDLGRPDLGRPGSASQDFPRRDPGRTDFSSYSTYGGQQDQAEQAPTQANRSDADLAARMDPALQDFFSPAKTDPRYNGSRPSPAAPPSGLPGREPGVGLPGREPGVGRADQGQGQGLPGQGRTSPGLPGPGQPGYGWADAGQQMPGRSLADGRGPQRPSRASGPLNTRADRPSPGSRGGQDRPGDGGGRRVQDDVLPASRGKRILAIGAVVVVVAAGGAYLALHGTKSSNNTVADNVPTFSPSASAVASSSSSAANHKTKGSTKKSGVTSNAAAAGGYVLSAPSTAAGYPLGTDPKFLATATTTVAAIEQTAVGGGAGKATGSPVSASYTLPAAQTIEFVGYQGTFDPAKVMANLKSYGSAEKSYPAGKNGGLLECANTTATSTTPSGAVCVWVTKSTLGFTEFFTQAAGPEALNTAQAKGAEDTLKLRSSVEKLKSS